MITVDISCRAAFAQARSLVSDFFVSLVMADALADQDEPAESMQRRPPAGPPENSANSSPRTAASSAKQPERSPDLVAYLASLCA
jgi:hypothetical protein